MFQVNPHMKNQALFSSKDKSKKLKCRLLQFLFGALRVERKKNAFVGANLFLSEKTVLEGRNHPGKEKGSHKSCSPRQK